MLLLQQRLLYLRKKLHVLNKTNGSKSFLMWSFTQYNSPTAATFISPFILHNQLHCTIVLVIAHNSFTFIMRKTVLRVIIIMMKYSNLGETTSCQILYLMELRFLGMNRHSGFALIAKSMHCFCKTN